MSTMSMIDFVVVDDSGLLGLVDCNAYDSFISSNWTYESIIKHFGKATGSMEMAIWDCGDGGDSYLVRMREGMTTDTGFREATGAIRVTGQSLYLVSYDSLTMAAQFADDVLPSKYESEHCISVPPGDYRLRVMQMYDPSQLARPAIGEPHFIVEYEPGNAEKWDGVAWLMKS